MASLTATTRATVLASGRRSRDASATSMKNLLWARPRSPIVDADSTRAANVRMRAS